MRRWATKTQAPLLSPQTIASNLMKLLLIVLSLGLCSCSQIDFAGVAKTPYGDVTYKSPVVPEK